MKKNHTIHNTIRKFLPAIALSIIAVSFNAQAAKPEKVDIPKDAVFYKKTATWVYYRGKKQIILYENKFRKAEGNFINEKRDGTWTFWYDNGNLKGEGKYEEGTMAGPWKLYFEDGTLKAEGNYKNNLKDSTWTLYYESGAKKSVGTFVAGVKHGPWTEYYKNGQVFFNGNYKFGLSDGNWEFFFESGKLYQKGSYFQDRKEGEWMICIYPDAPCQTQTISRPSVPGTTGLAPADEPGSAEKKNDAESILKSMDDYNGAESGSPWGDN